MAQGLGAFHIPKSVSVRPCLPNHQMRRTRNAASPMIAPPISTAARVWTSDGQSAMFDTRRSNEVTPRFTTYSAATALTARTQAERCVSVGAVSTEVDVTAD